MSPGPFSGVGPCLQGPARNISLQLDVSGDIKAIPAHVRDSTAQRDKISFLSHSSRGTESVA